MTTDTCKQCGRPLICPHCVGSIGGKATSEAKRAASQANGRLGGRPKKQKKS